MKWGLSSLLSLLSFLRSLIENQSLMLCVRKRNQCWKREEEIWSEWWMKEKHAPTAFFPTSNKTNEMIVFQCVTNIENISCLFLSLLCKFHVLLSLFFLISPFFPRLHHPPSRWRSLLSCSIKEQCAKLYLKISLLMWKMNEDERRNSRRSTDLTNSQNWNGEKKNRWIQEDDDDDDDGLLFRWRSIKIIWRRRRRSFSKMKTREWGDYCCYCCCYVVNRCRRLFYSSH